MSDDNPRMRAPSTRIPRTVLVVDSVRAAREGLAETPADEVLFSVVPADLGDLTRLPPGSRVELPWDLDALPAYHPAGLKVRIRLARRGFSTVEEACRTLLRLSTERLPSSIEDVDSLTEAEALRLVDLFLRDPGITAPVEPFASLLVSMIRRTRLCLWDLLAPDASRRVVVSRGGQEAEAFAARLSDRSARAGSENLLAELPATHPECLESWCFRFCEAWALWAGSCAAWRAILGRIARAARDLSAAEPPEVTRPSPPAPAT